MALPLKKSNYQTYFTEFFPPLGCCDSSKHHLRYVECVSPVVISDISVIFLDWGQKSTQGEVIYMESSQKIQIYEHAKSSLKKRNQKIVKNPIKLQHKIYLIINFIPIFNGSDHCAVVIWIKYGNRHWVGLRPLK